MKRALLLLCLAASASGGERVFLETETSRDTYFVHEPFRLTLRVGFDRDFFATSAVQMFSRELDLPVHVQAPWLGALDGAVLRGDGGAPAGGSVSLALNDDVVGADPGGERVRDGRPYAVVEITRTCVPTRPGELALGAPRLRYAHGTRFKEDFVHGRVALDRRDEVVDGEPRRLRILALPEEGRPPGFTGAVGRRFSLRAEAAPRTVEAGAILKLVLGIEGEGHLDLFDAPPLDGLGGRFHVYGRIDDRGASRRTITYDVAPLDAAVTEVPAIAFVYFDPAEPAGYRTVRTAPIPIEVRGGAAAAEPPGPPDKPRAVLPALAVGTALAVGLALVLWLRSRGRAAPAPGPAVAFQARVGADVAAALAEYLAARLQCAPAAVIAPDLPARLTAAGVPGALAGRAAALLEELVATRYGGAMPGDRAEAAARALVEELEASFERVA